LFIALPPEGQSEGQILRQLCSAIHEAVEKLPGWPDVSPVLIVDDLSILTSLGCKKNEVSIFFEELRSMICSHGGTIVCLVHDKHNNTDAESLETSLHHLVGHQSDVIIFVRPLKTGYCRDLSGEVYVRFITSACGFQTILALDSFLAKYCLNC